MSDDSLTDMFDVAAQAYDLFRSFMVAGFTESQALRLVANMLMAGQSDDGRNINQTSATMAVDMNSEEM